MESLVEAEKTGLKNLNKRIKEIAEDLRKRWDIERVTFSFIKNYFETGIRANFERLKHLMLV